MPIEYAWFLPSAKNGDGWKINAKQPERQPTVAYLSEVARAAERAGFVNLLVPTGTHCLDAWLAAAAVAQHTERIKFCVAFRPGLTSPVFAAQTANTLDAMTGGRVTVNVVTGSTPVDQMRYGDHLTHDERYERTDEFLQIVKALWRGGGPVTFQGKHFDVRDASFFPGHASRPHPAIYLGGSSEAGRRVGARHAGVHMMYAVELETIAQDAAGMRRRAAEFGREKDIRFGIRIHIVRRETREEARRAAEAMIEGSDISNTGVWADMRNRTGSAGQMRVNELARRGSLWVTDILWMGVNTVRAGAGASLVGTPDTIARALKEYIQAGVETFILSGWPHVEEAGIFGREVMPLLQDTAPVTLVRPAAALA
ncbi:MAG: LLM class flavin-dependent oxidoreductase [Candidatus Tectomicrobia bacterium]|nr:LLM class flavin-dependent oxidoreductase [Candidatus Tectomicrobia bacterium]